MSYALIAAAMAAQFNLTCEGTVQTKAVPYIDRSEQFSRAYRFDLDKRVYCEGTCAALHKIEVVNPTQLVLESSASDTPRSKRTANITIDRQTGEYSALISSDSRATGLIVIKMEGTCTPSSFTGFPEFETMF